MNDFSLHGIKAADPATAVRAERRLSFPDDLRNGASY
jgi:hypothetical protein